MSAKFLLIFLSLTVVYAQDDKIAPYLHLQDQIQKFLDSDWAMLKSSVKSHPTLTKETSLLEAFDVMLSPMLVSANGKTEHAQAMSAFCYNYFQAGLDMTRDHIQKDIYLTNDKTFISQLNNAQAKMKKLQGQCISTLTSVFTHGILGFFLSIFKGVIPI